MSRLQMTGLASGMDTSSMVDKLMEVERRPIYLKQEEIQKVQFQKKHWEDIGGQVRQFRSVAQEMTRDNVFRKKISTVSDDRLVDIELGPSASKGTYIIEDIELARPGQATSTFSLDLADEVKTHINGDRLNVRPNAKFIDMYLSLFGNTRFEEVGFKVNGQEIHAEAGDSIGTFINKINASGTGVKASFDMEGNFIKLESEDNSPIEISADDRTFLRGLGLHRYNGQKIENNVPAEYKQSMSDVRDLSQVRRGFFTINDFTVEVNPDFDSIDDIVRRLNAEDSPIKAYFDEGSKKLNLVAQEAGDDIFIQDDTSNFLNVLGLMDKNPMGRVVPTLHEGKKASFMVDNVRYERNSNDITFNGIRLNFLGNTEPNQSITVTVDNDYDAMIGKIEDFVQTYNDTIAVINSKTVKDAPLQGNTTANTLASNLRRFMGNSVNGVDSRYSQLALIGINTMGREPNLFINYDKLKEALSENPEEVEKLFIQNEADFSGIVGTGDGSRKRFATSTRNNPDEIQVKVGNRVFSRNGRNRLMTRSEFERNKLSRSELIKYVINGDIRSKSDLDGRLGRSIPNNMVLIDDVTGALEFGRPPRDGESVVVESIRSINKSQFGSNQGIVNQVDNYLNPFVSFGGTFERQSRAFDTRIRQMNDWISRTDDRLKMREDALKRQFAGMEGSMQYSNSQSNWLSGQIAQL